MEQTKKHIILVAGEASGDIHGAHLVEAVKKIDPSLSFSGLGGSHMQQAGVTLYQDLTSLAVIGFVEVLKHYGEIKKSFDLILSKIKETKPAAVILIDYPGFNLRLAKEIKKLNLPTKVIYYISPQVWAWKANRVHLIKEYVDTMLVFFRFEEEFYGRYGIKVTWIGHPLIEIIKSSLNSSVQENFPTIGILPGSRAKEIERHLPLMLDTAEILLNDFPQMKFKLIKAHTVSQEMLTPYTSSHNLPLEIVDQDYNQINALTACMVASGTATLEIAILKKPMVIVYKTSLLTWFIAKNLIKIPYIGLVNVVAGEKIVPECIQFEATPQNVARELKKILSSQEEMARMKVSLEKLYNTLGTEGALNRAAREILRTIK